VLLRWHPADTRGPYPAFRPRGREARQIPRLRERSCPTQQGARGRNCLGGGGQTATRWWATAGYPAIGGGQLPGGRRRPATQRLAASATYLWVAADYPAMGGGLLTGDGRRPATRRSAAACYPAVGGGRLPGDGGGRLPGGGRRPATRH
jgi:hypothetical protein